MLKLGIMQPYFFPYIGYWQLISAVDHYIIYDDVNFIKSGWVNRNNILLNNKAHLIRLHLNQASYLKKINEIEIEDNPIRMRKILATLKQGYAKAPYFNPTMILLERIFNYSEKNLASFNLNHIKEICNYLEINTKLTLSSSIKQNSTLKGKDRVIEICRENKTDIYINAIGGKNLYNKEEFEKNGITLKFIKSRNIEYKQFKNNNFVPWLSIIDIMMFNDKKEIRSMLSKYELL
mgnify:CR=1 FL=1|tara:strand:+ start:3057 stop:3761 length:705 start_codon:yes stop_codon:yes gene_type:complete